MAFSQREFSGNGVTSQFEIPFLFISPEDIRVSLNEEPLVFEQDYEVIETDQGFFVDFYEAPVSGDVGMIYRMTSPEKRLVQWRAPSPFKEDDLNLEANQFLFRLQELTDRVDADGFVPSGSTVIIDDEEISKELLEDSIKTGNEASSLIADLEAYAEQEIAKIRADVQEVQDHAQEEVQNTRDNLEDKIENDVAAARDDAQAALDSAYSTLQDAINGIESDIDPDAYATKAELEENYYTFEQVDAAIAAKETQLTAQLTDGVLDDGFWSDDGLFFEDDEWTDFGNDVLYVQATLDETYLTVAEVDQAISTRLTEFESTLVDPEGPIGKVEATLEEEYYTIAQTDQAISGAVTTLESELEGVIDSEIESIYSMLEVEYLTSTEVDQALASLQTTLESQIDDVSANIQENYLTSSEVDSAIAAVKTDLETQIGNVESTLTTEYITEVETDQAISTAITEFNTSLTEPGGAVHEVEASIYDNFYTISEADQAIAGQVTEMETQLQGEIENAKQDAIADVESTLQQDYTLSSEIDQSLTALETNLTSEYQVYVDNELENYYTKATIDNDFYTKASADQAIAAQIQSFDAEVEGGLKASVETHKSAIAELDDFASAFAAVTVETEGGGIAGFRAVSYENADGSGSSALELLGDQVVVPGSLTSRSLTVTDGSGNLIINGDFLSGDDRGWEYRGDDPPYFAKYSDEGSSATDEDVVPNPYMFVFRNTDSGGIRSETFKVKPGDDLIAAFDYGAGGSSPRDVSFRALFRFLDADGNWLEGHGWSDYSPSYSGVGWADRYSSTTTVPEGAAYCNIQFTRDPDTADKGTGFLTNLECRRREDGRTIIKPGSVTTEEINTDDFNANGLAVFGGEVKSDDFESGENGSGWGIFQDGTAEFDGISVRDGSLGTAKIVEQGVTQVRFSSSDQGDVTLNFTVDGSGRGEAVILCSGRVYVEHTDPDGGLISSGVQLQVDGSKERSIGTVVMSDGQKTSGAFSIATRITVDGSASLTLSTYNVQGTNMTGSVHELRDASITVLETKK